MNKKPASNNSDHSEKNPVLRILISSLKSAALTSVIAASLLLLLGFAAYCYYDPDSLVNIFGYSALGLCSIISGFASARFNGENALLCGLASGGIMTLLILLISTALSSGELLSLPLSLTAHLAVTALSALGGIIGRKRDKPHKKIKIPK